MREGSVETPDCSSDKSPDPVFSHDMDLKEAIQLMLHTEREEVFRLDPKAEIADLVLA
jgi:hypothetical protein